MNFSKENLTEENLTNDETSENASPLTIKTSSSLIKNMSNTPFKSKSKKLTGDIFDFLPLEKEDISQNSDKSSNNERCKKFLAKTYVNSLSWEKNPSASPVFRFEDQTKGRRTLSHNGHALKEDISRLLQEAIEIRNKSPPKLDNNFNFNEAELHEACDESCEANRIITMKDVESAF